MIAERIQETEPVKLDFKLLICDCNVVGQIDRDGKPFALNLPILRASTCSRGTKRASIPRACDNIGFKQKSKYSNRKLKITRVN